MQSSSKIKGMPTREPGESFLSFTGEVDIEGAVVGGDGDPDTFFVDSNTITEENYLQELSIEEKKDNYEDQELQKTHHNEQIEKNYATKFSRNMFDPNKETCLESQTHIVLMDEKLFEGAVLVDQLLTQKSNIQKVTFDSCSLTTKRPTVNTTIVRNSHPKVTSLVIKCSLFDKESLVDLIGMFPNLASLSIQEYIGKNFIEILETLKTLVPNYNISELEISGIIYCHLDMIKFSEAVERGLKELLITFGEKGTLKKLNLSRSALSTEFVRSLGKELEVRKTLRTLILSQCFLGVSMNDDSEGVLELLQKSEFNVLESLNISQNDFSFFDKVEELNSFGSRFPKLKKLNLRGCSLTTDQITNLFQSSIDTLQQLNLSDNDLDDRVFLAVNKLPLERLVLRNCNLLFKDAQKTPLSQKLKYIDISNQRGFWKKDVQPQVLVFLDRLLKAVPNIERVVCYGLDFGNEVDKSLKPHMQKIKSGLLISKAKANHTTIKKDYKENCDYNNDEEHLYRENDKQYQKKALKKNDRAFGDLVFEGHSPQAISDLPLTGTTIKANKNIYPGPFIDDSQSLLSNIPPDQKSSQTSTSIDIVHTFQEFLNAQGIDTLSNFSQKVEPQIDATILRLPLSSQQNLSLVPIRISGSFLDELKQEEVIQLSIYLTTEAYMQMDDRTQHLTRANTDILVEVLNYLNLHLSLGYTFSMNLDNPESGSTWLSASFLPVVGGNPLSWLVGTFDLMMLVVGIIQEERLFDRILVEDMEGLCLSILQRVKLAMQYYDDSQKHRRAFP